MQYRPNLVAPGREQPPDSALNKLVISYPECSRFVPSRAHHYFCICGRAWNDPIHGDPDAAWAMELNTISTADPMYGTLINGAQFVRLSLNTPERKVERIFDEAWKLPKPRLIMSILGGLQQFTFSDQLESNFINSIIDVALSSDAWLITGGYNVGIIKLVGQAIRKANLTQRNNNLVAIGVCKWGSVKDVETLIKRPSRNLPKTNRSEDEWNRGDQGKRRSGEQSLQMDHTHYLMLDDGRVRDYDIKDYRTRICVQLSKHDDAHYLPTPIVTIVVEGGRDALKNMYHDLRADIPVVIIDGSGRIADFFKRWLIYTSELDDDERSENEPADIDNIHRIPAPDEQSATPDVKTPPVRNSTGASQHQPEYNLCNLKNMLLEIFKEYRVQMEDDLQRVLSSESDSKKLRKRKMTKSGNENEQNICSEDCNYAMFCLQPAVRSNISIFNLNTDVNLSETIFRSICKSQQRRINRKEAEQEELERRQQARLKSAPDDITKKKQAVSQAQVNRKTRISQRTELLELAMNWNCIDVAKELILKNSLENIINQHDAFLYALKHDLPTFIYEFLKLGLEPANIFFPDDGEQRYQRFFKELYNGGDEYKTKLEKTHLTYFIEVIGENSSRRIQNAKDMNIVLRKILGDYVRRFYFFTDREEIEYYKIIVKGVDTAEPGDDVKTLSLMKKDDLIIRDLFLWAILHNHIDMAKVFLAYMPYRICAALIATDILRKFHSKANYGDLKDAYLAGAGYFENYAIACINQCEKNDANMACEIVLQEIDFFGNATCLQVAFDASDKPFVSRPCCVQAINNVWNDKIDSSHSERFDWLRIAGGILSFGLLAPALVDYREEKSDKLQKSRKRLKSNGINYSDPYPLENPNPCNFPLPVNQYILRVINFHRAPRIKYFYRCLFYCFFLLLFSYVLLFKFAIPSNGTPSIDWTEVLTLLIVSSMLVEELQFLLSLDNVTLWGKIRSYYKNVFKWLVMLSFLLFYIGLALRFAVTDNEVNFTAARIVMAIALEIFWLRSLAFIIVSSDLGPSLVAIARMLQDLLFFMCIIAVVMAGYGVASRSMFYYPHKEDYVPYNASLGFDGRSIFRDIAYPVYYMMYGNVGPELSNLDQNLDASYAIATHVLLAIHVLFVNILLTNLLIAMFSKRFDRVYEDNQKIWHSQKYQLTREYYSRAPLFPPFSVLYDSYHLIRLLFYAIRKSCDKGENPAPKVFKMIAMHSSEVKKWNEFEAAHTYEYAHAQVKESRLNASGSMVGLESRAKDSTEETYKKKVTADESTENMKTMQGEIAKLNVALERIGQQLTLRGQDYYLRQAILPDLVQPEDRRMDLPGEEENEQGERMDNMNVTSTTSRPPGRKETREERFLLTLLSSSIREQSLNQSSSDH